MISYRKMNAGDISAGLSLCRAAGWNQLSRDWELFIHNNPDGARVAVSDDGIILGTVTTLRYEDHFSWIGMVLVDPVMRSQGIGNALLQQALNILSNEKSIKLDATPAGREVYLKRDFRDEYALTRMHLDKIDVAGLPSSYAIPLREKDITEVLKFDRKVFGADRCFVLNWLFEGSPGLAFVTKESHGITGYCFGRRGHNFTQIGPVIATDVRGALNLVTAAMRSVAEGPVIVDVLHHTPEWIAVMESLGFVELRHLIRMYKGSNAWPGMPQNQFAIAGPEIG